MKPITAPPLKASGSASAAPWRAALAVRVLAAVAMRIPMKPAIEESTAPIRYAMEAYGRPSIGTTNNTMNMTPTKTDTHWYSRRKNAMAPSRMASPISFMRSVPSSAFITTVAK